MFYERVLFYCVHQKALPAWRQDKVMAGPHTEVQVLEDAVRALSFVSTRYPLVRGSFEVKAFCNGGAVWREDVLHNNNKGMEASCRRSFQSEVAEELH